MAINLSIYSIDFSKVSQRLCPWFWRKPVFLSYINAALAPLQTDNTEMFSFVNTVWTKLAYTGQHLAVEEFLNDNYDDSLRRIFITENNIVFDSVDLYEDGETDPSPLSLYEDGETDPAPISFYQDGEGTGGDNFTINIPTGVSYDETLLRNQVDFYLVAGKSYNIVTF